MEPPDDPETADEADMSLLLIRKRVPPYGLAPARWREQLAEIRGLSER